MIIWYMDLNGFNEIGVGPCDLVSTNPKKGAEHWIYDSYGFLF